MSFSQKISKFAVFFAPLLAALVLLTVVYLPTLQTIPNGSSQLMMIDVGETQVVLNTWGTLHATGYPHYVILGNLLVSLFKAVGFSAATAPALVSWLWGFAGLVLFYVLSVHLTEKKLPAALVVLIFGLTRFVWIHHIIAEIYSFALFLLLLLSCLALWKKPLPFRISLLVLVGGISVAHHRALVMVAPALIFAVWPELWAELRHRPYKIFLWVFLVFIGFLPYLYLPLRAAAGGEWVYGEPDTLRGFWDQFSAPEFAHLFGVPESFDQFKTNFDSTNRTLADEVSPFGIAIGIVGLILATLRPQYRRVALTLILGSIASYIFQAAFYFVILATPILCITLALAFGWLFLLESAFNLPAVQKIAALKMATTGVFLVITGFYSGWLVNQNQRWIRHLTHDETGLQMIDLAANTPPDSILMQSWGPHYTAVGFGKDVTGEIGGFTQVDHNGNFAVLVKQTTLVIPEFTLFNQSLPWWEQRIGGKVYLRAVAPFLIQIDDTPKLLPENVPLPNNPEPAIAVIPLEYRLRCVGVYRALYVEWLALQKPDRNLSVMVHVLNANSDIIAYGDKFAPVYGWRPLTDWLPREIVQDVYPLPPAENAVSVRFGLYEQLPNGEFQNYHVHIVPIDCKPAQD